MSSPTDSLPETNDPIKSSTNDPVNFSTRDIIESSIKDLVKSSKQDATGKKLPKWKHRLWICDQHGKQFSLKFGEEPEEQTHIRRKQWEAANTLVEYCLSENYEAMVLSQIRNNKTFDVMIIFSMSSSCSYCSVEFT
ncbi:5444_t:CDS:2 [Paraglomus brasilianum]|uniref:5444_t:CDS:1 n=1 Tax=Paraglomus brasilianum TaxID=144538 RepID=A0A9N9GXP1_9GLOM|nr:5444_t:CDS:2 [Paraglomus brasilianum]